MMAYLVVFLAGTALNIFLVLKSTGYAGVTQIFQWAYLLCSLLSVTLFAIVSLIDPGFVPRSTVPLTTLYATSRMEDVCPDCMALRPPRARHCQCCSRCVLKFDHHCPWLSNCIGARNLGWFYLFLLTTDACLGISAYMNLTAVFLGVSGALVPLPVFYLRIAAAALFALSVFFGVPLTLLFFVQSQNFVLNRTTNERFARQPLSLKASDSFADSMSSAQRVDRSNPCLNCVRMCCNAGDNVKGNSGYESLPA